eukprot:2927648-Rhodomonas_salina.1
MGDVVVGHGQHRDLPPPHSSLSAPPPSSSPAPPLPACTQQRRAQRSTSAAAASSDALDVESKAGRGGEGRGCLLYTSPSPRDRG